MARITWQTSARSCAGPLPLKLSRPSSPGHGSGRLRQDRDGGHRPTSRSDRGPAAGFGGAPGPFRQARVTAVSAPSAWTRGVSARLDRQPQLRRSPEVGRLSLAEGHGPWTALRPHPSPLAAVRAPTGNPAAGGQQVGTPVTDGEYPGDDVGVLRGDRRIGAIAGSGALCSLSDAELPVQGGRVEPTRYIRGRPGSDGYPTGLFAGRLAEPEVVAGRFLLVRDRR
jgi:hypothetical protein